jgi:hypothetical protein
MSVDDRADIGPVFINSQMHLNLAGRLEFSIHSLALKIHNHHVFRF